MPPPAGTRVGCSGISLARPLAGSGLLLIALLLPVARHRCGARLMAWRYYHARSSLDLPSAVIGSIMRKNQNFKELCCCPYGLSLVCRLELHQRPPRLCPALSCLSYGRNGAYTALVMRSTIWSMVTESLFIALMMSTRARTLSCSCMYHL